MVENLNSDENQNTATTSDGTENTAPEFTPEQQSYLEKSLIPGLRARFSTQQSQITNQDKTELETLRAAERQRGEAEKQAEEKALADKGQYEELVKTKDDQLEEWRLKFQSLNERMESEQQARLIEAAVSQALATSNILPEMQAPARQLFRTGLELDGQAYHLGVVEGEAVMVDSGGNRVITASGEHLTLEMTMDLFGQQYPAFIRPTTVGGSGAIGSSLASKPSVNEAYNKAHEKASQTGKQADLREAMRLRKQVNP